MDWFFLRHFKKDLNFFFSFVVSLRERNHIIRAIVFQTMLITQSHVYGSGLPPKIKALLYWFILEKKNLNQHKEERSPLEHQSSVLFLLFFFLLFVFVFAFFFCIAVNWKSSTVRYRIDVAIIIAAFLLCYLPGWLMGFCRQFVPGIDVQAEVVHATTCIFFPLSSSCNPIIYSICKREFRATIKKMSKKLDFVDILSTTITTS